MLFDLDNPYMQIKKNGSLKKTYTHFNLIPKEKSNQEKNLEKMVTKAKKVQKTKERKLQNEKKYQALLDVLAKEKMLLDQADSLTVQKERKVLRQKSIILKEKLLPYLSNKRIKEQMDADVDNKLKTMEMSHLNIVENQFTKY